MVADLDTRAGHECVARIERRGRRRHDGDHLFDPRDSRLRPEHGLPGGERRPGGTYPSARHRLRSGDSRVVASGGRPSSCTTPARFAGEAALQPRSATASAVGMLWSAGGVGRGVGAVAWAPQPADNFAAEVVACRALPAPGCCHRRSCPPASAALRVAPARPASPAKSPRPPALPAPAAPASGPRLPPGAPLRARAAVAPGRSAAGRPAPAAPPAAPASGAGPRATAVRVAARSRAGRQRRPPP